MRNSIDRGPADGDSASVDPINPPAQPARDYALLLAGLAFAFLLRVTGQILVALDLAPFLPPMQEWYSGLLAYPVLLAGQIVILALQVLISRDLWQGSGFFAHRRPLFGRFLFWFSVIYFGVMVVRYILTMTWNPELRWFTGTIPIFFHWVLAAYVFFWSRYHRSH
jgi:hypothetical protein